MKVIYLTWGETPRDSGVYGSQVVSQLISNQQQISSAKFALVSGLPIIFSGLVREKFSYIQELNKIRQNLDNIPHKIIYIWGPQNFYYSRRYEFHFFHHLSHQQLLKFIREFSADIIHCRSYHATYAALQIRDTCPLNYKVVFDPRGLWPEEGVLKGRIRENSFNYQYNKQIEKYLLKKSDITVSVSDTMQKHYEALGTKNCRTIYLSAPAQALKTKQANIIKKDNILCYVGALNDKTWHKPRFLFELYQQYRKCISNAKLLIVTQSNHREILNQRGEIPLSEVEITATYTPQELATCLQRSTFGALPYFIPSSHCEYIVAETVIASKTAEYLAAGLPVLVNRYCGGAREVIQRNSLGLIYDPENLETVSCNSLSKLMNQNISLICSKFAEENFSMYNNSIRYQEIYYNLISTS